MSLHHRRALRLFYWLPPLALMAVIFALSSRGVESGEDSYEIVVRLLELFRPHSAQNFSHDALDTLNALFRKTCHFGGYALLAGLFLRAVKFGRRRGTVRDFLLALAFTILYALSDEFHQLFVPGRGAHLTDVFIDTAGGVLTLSVAALCELHTALQDRLHSKAATPPIP